MDQRIVRNPTYLALNVMVVIGQVEGAEQVQINACVVACRNLWAGTATYWMKSLDGGELRESEPVPNTRHIGLNCALFVELIVHRFGYR